MRNYRRQRGAAMLETVLVYMFVMTATLAVGTKLQEAQTRFINTSLAPLHQALR